MKVAWVQKKLDILENFFYKKFKKRKNFLFLKKEELKNSVKKAKDQRR